MTIRIPQRSWGILIGGGWTAGLVPGVVSATSMIKNCQYQQLRKEFTRKGNVSLSALKSGMDRKTARKYLKAKKAPSELQKQHDWRTRVDPLESIWPQAEKMLADAPELESKALFEFFQQQPQSKLSSAQLRT